MKSRWVKFLVASVFSVVIGLGVWAFWLEPASTTTVHETLSISQWPKECAGLRVIVLADLHVGAPHKDLESLNQLVARVNRLNGDLVLLAGDYVIQGVLGGTFVEPEALARSLGSISAQLGTYAVLGNHDWWLDGARVAAAFTDVAIPVLEDHSLELQWKSCRFNLMGLSDWWEGEKRYARATSSANQSLPTIAFTHNPDIFPLLRGGFNLLIAGHTHGGQVNLPFVGRPVVPSEYGQRYAIGHIEEQGSHLYVNPGIGTSILPVRFRVPPEVTVLEIVAK